MGAWLLHRSEPAMLLVRASTVFAMAVTLGSGTALAGPASQPAPRRSARVLLDGIVAVVNDEIILLSELERASGRHPLMRETLSQMPANASQQQIARARTEVEAQVLDELIHTMLSRVEAKKFEIEVSEADIDRALPSIASQYDITVAELRKQVESTDEYESWSEYRSELRDQLLQLQVSRQLASWSVRDADVREHYRTMTKDESAKVAVKQFTFAPAGAEAADRDQAFARAQGAARKLRDGVAPEAVASELGIDDDLAKTIARGDVAPTLEDAVFAAKRGAVVGPLASGQGYVVYLVVEHVAGAALSFDQAKDRIRQQLEGEAFLKAEKELRAQLRAKAHVEVRL